MRWEPYHSGTSVFVVDKLNNAIICRIMVGDASADVRDANASLIGAAPDLLEALEELMACKQGEFCEQYPAAYKKAQAAIAKARGEA